ncbi:MAG: hypothetical protein ACPHTB_08875 [Candidatus Puniceispirillaceae bacterium]
MKKELIVITKTSDLDDLISRFSNLGGSCVTRLVPAVVVEGFFCVVLAGEGVGELIYVLLRACQQLM